MAISVLHTPLKVSLSGNKVPVKLSTDLTGSEKSFLTIHLKVQKYDGSSWVDVGHDSKLVDDNNEAVFYIEDYLKLQTTPDFSYPEHKTNILIDRPEMIFRYRIAYYESYYDTSANTLTTTSESQDSTDYYALEGGIDKQAEAAYNDSNTDWLEQLTEGNQFLTWQPDTKRVHTGFIDKLYWLVQSVSTVKVKAKKTDKNGNTSTDVMDTLSVSAHTVVEVCVSPGLLYSDLSDIDKIDIWLLDGSDNVISQTRTYKIDRRYYERNDTFAFKNSFGVFDFVWARGNMSEQVEYERQSFTRSLQYNQFMKNHSSDQSRAMKENTGQSEIGYITEADPVAWKQYYAEEFLASEKYYKLESTQVIPVVLTSEKSTLFKDKQHIYSQAFGWRRSHRNRFFSRQAIEFKNILPPYYADLEVAFFRKHLNMLKSLRGSHEAKIEGSYIIFPEITDYNNNNIFDLTETSYWDSSVTSADWYIYPGYFPISQLNGELLADYATPMTHNRLFFHDAGSDIRKALPILVYSRGMTTEERKKIVDWLDWYFFVQENGSFLTEDGNYITEKH